MKVVTGDLIQMALDGEFDVIVHGCNCFCTMGAGIAKQIKEVFPEAYEADLNTKKGDIHKLGSYSAANVTKNEHDITIFNAYTQYSYGRGKHVEYAAIASAFFDLDQSYNNGNNKIGFPLIGAGLGGGDWNIISQIIDYQMQYSGDYTLVRR